MKRDKGTKQAGTKERVDIKREIDASVVMAARSDPTASQAELSRRTGVNRKRVAEVLRKYHADPATLAEYKENSADVYDSLAGRLLASMGTEVIEKMSGKDRVIAAATATDKARLIRGEAGPVPLHGLVAVVFAADRTARTGYSMVTPDGRPNANMPDIIDVTDVEPLLPEQGERLPALPGTVDDDSAAGAAGAAHIKDRASTPPGGGPHPPAPAQSSPSDSQAWRKNSQKGPPRKKVVKKVTPGKRLSKLETRMQAKGRRLKKDRQCPSSPAPSEPQTRQEEENE